MAGHLQRQEINRISRHCHFWFLRCARAQQDPGLYARLVLDAGYEKIRRELSCQINHINEGLAWVIGETDEQRQQRKRQLEAQLDRAGRDYRAAKRSQQQQQTTRTAPLSPTAAPYVPMQQ